MEMSLTHAKHAKYVVLIDILGFEVLAKEIAQQNNLEPRKVRADFLAVLQKRISELRTRGIIQGSSHSQRDDWILTIRDLDGVFRLITGVFDHNTGYVGHEQIPLEIAVGTLQLDKWAAPEGSGIIVEDEIITFVKRHLLEHYHIYHRELHNNKSPASSFIVLTQSVYETLHPVDRDKCVRIMRRFREADITFFAAKAGEFEERGRTISFLDSIGERGSTWYSRIDELFISPIGYEDMKQILDTRKCLVITGTPEFGKTYIAVRLLYEYHKRGLLPRWIRGTELLERMAVRRSLERAAAELSEGEIVYFEDPFGKSSYEEREILEREFGAVLNAIEWKRDCYVIITSREEILNEFLRRIPSSEINRLLQLTQAVNIGKPSYDLRSREGILKGWARAYDCSWLANPTLKEHILDSLQNANCLPSPLSIRQFALDTVRVNTKRELDAKLSEKSQETSEAFAKEIARMSDDKALFLSFLFISDLHVDSLRALYNRLVESMKVIDAMDFDGVLGWFIDNKVKFAMGGTVVFSHSSYSEALPHLLLKHGSPTRFGRHIFRRMLIGVAKLLPPQSESTSGKPVSMESSSNTAFRTNLSMAIFRYMTTIPMNLWDEEDKAIAQLFSVQGMDEHAAYLLMASADKIPDSILRESLLRVCDSDVGARVIARSLAPYYDKLPSGILHDIVMKLSEKPSLMFDLGWSISSIFRLVDRDVTIPLLERLVEEREGVDAVVQILYRHFDAISEEDRDRLVSKLASRWGLIDLDESLKQRHRFTGLAYP